jgi:hypothetical protein
MSDYTIEISGNQPYYVEVDNSNIQEIVNLTISKDNDVNVEVSTSNTFITFEMASGYPIEATSGDLPYSRVSDLGTYIQSFIPQQSGISINGGTP